MKEIPLTQGKTTLVDDRDYEMLTQYKWCAGYNPTSKRWVAMRRNSDNKIELMHRLIMGSPNGMLIDHTNHNALDNRRVNLRLCTHRGNAGNSRIPINNTSGFKGVDYHKKMHSWRAQIWDDRTRVTVGFYATPEMAAAAYDQAAREHFGSFALTNAMLGLLEV